MWLNDVIILVWFIWCGIENMFYLKKQIVMVLLTSSFGVRNIFVMDIYALLFEYLCICYVLTKKKYI
jgi:hypothetical protein